MTSKTHSMRFVVLHPALAFSMALLLLTGSTHAAQAQSGSPAPPPASACAEISSPPGPAPVWQANFAKQLTKLLTSRIGSVRENALQLTIFYATVHGDEVDLKATVPTLMYIYEYDASEAHRLMALSALHALDDASSMRYLARRLLYVKERTPRIRALTISALADHLRKREMKENEGARLKELSAASASGDMRDRSCHSEIE